MGDFENWAGATFRQAHIVVDDDDLAFVQLIYVSSMTRLSVLDRINLDDFPSRAIDLRRAPDLP